ncbi:MAG: hypothetical protein K0S42_3615 [Microvirga sp.]|nr:hypothetical protein [Microvirga sp.]
MSSPVSASRFDHAVELVLQHEGGFVHHAQDPGGATKFGITRETLSRVRGRPATIEDVRALTRAEAVAVYRRLYWDAVRGDDLPPGLDLAVFDLAVNSGPARAVRMLQTVLGVAVDGIVGPVTLEAAWQAEPADTRAGGSAACFFPTPSLQERLTCSIPRPFWPAALSGPT